MPERRKYPRADVAISIRTEGAAGAEDIRTVNLSAAGVAFESPRWVEPFTKLEMFFVFPSTPDNGNGEERLVRVEAVVMRTEPEAPQDDVGAYRVACCFTSIRDEDQDYVTAYVERVVARSEAKA